MLTLVSCALVLGQPNFAANLDRPLEPIREQAIFDEAISKIKNRERANGSTRFYFLRHGRSDGKELNLAGGGAEIHGLTAEGGEIVKAQADKLFQQGPFSGIFTSNYKSAIETAEIYASKNSESLKVAVDERLRQMHWGTYHAKPIDDTYKQMKMKGEKELESINSFWDKFNFKFEHGMSEEESLKDVFDRTVQFLTEKMSQPDLKGKDVLVVTHTPQLKAIFSALVAYQQFKALEYHRFDFTNGGVVVLDITEDGDAYLADVQDISFRGHTKYER